MSMGTGNEAEPALGTGCSAGDAPGQQPRTKRTGRLDLPGTTSIRQIRRARPSGPQRNRMMKRVTSLVTLRAASPALHDTQKMSCSTRRMGDYLTDQHAEHQLCVERNRGAYLTRQADKSNIITNKGA